MDVLLIVDMQVGLLNDDPKHDLPGVIDRINRLGAGVRAQSGVVIFIQHCVDATVRSAVTNRHNVVVATDAHTLSDRPHLDALGVKGHHHWVWNNLIGPNPVRLATTDELLP